jgi:hypothetical protein
LQVQEAVLIRGRFPGSAAAGFRRDRDGLRALGKKMIANEGKNLLRSDGPAALLLVGTDRAESAGMAVQIRFHTEALRPVGAGVPGLSRGQKNGGYGTIQAGGQVHGAGVVGHQQGGMAENRRQLVQGGSPDKVDERMIGLNGVVPSDRERSAVVPSRTGQRHILSQNRLPSWAKYSCGHCLRVSLAPSCKATKPRQPGGASAARRLRISSRVVVVGGVSASLWP